MTPNPSWRHSAGAEINFKKLIIMVNYQTNYGEDIWILGDKPYFGNWNPDVD